MRLPPPSYASISTTTLDNGFLSITKKKPLYGENWSSLIGIITAIVGNVLISFALNMQRYAHIRLERELQEKERQRKKRSASGTSLSRFGSSKRNGASENEPLLQRVDGEEEVEGAYKQKSSYLKSPYWWAGIILMTVGEAGNFLAYGFAPASIVSPLGVVALISNCIIAPFMLKEPFRKRDALGVIVAVGGAVTVVLSANDNNPKLGPDEIWKLITAWEFETYLGVTVGVILVLMWASNRYGEKSVLIDLGLVGLFGGYTALSTKGVSSLLSYRLWRVVTFPVFYVLLLVLITTAIMQIKYVNRALQRFDATQVIPVQFVLFTLSVILGSAVLYRDFERTSGDDAGKFVGGCAMTFLGVALITTGRPQRDDDDDEDREPEPEDAINLAEDPYHDEAGGSTTRRSSTNRASSPDTTRPITPAMNTNLMSENTWTEPSTTSNIPPLPRQTSTPILPSEAAPLSSNLTARSDPELIPPRTPTRGKSQTEIPTTPGTSTPQLRRLRTAERIRAQGPLLASPLSTTLSAMVQDLKRKESFRGERRQSVLGISADGDGMGEPLSRRQTGPEEGSVPGGRGRSFSGTLGGLIRGLSGRKSRESMVGEESGEGRR